MAAISSKPHLPSWRTISASLLAVLGNRVEASAPKAPDWSPYRGQPRRHRLRARKLAAWFGREPAPVHVSRRLRRPGCGARALRFYGPRVERDRPDPAAMVASARVKVGGIVRNLAKRRRHKAA